MIHLRSGNRRPRLRAVAGPEVVLRRPSVECHTPRRLSESSTADLAGVEMPNVLLQSFDGKSHEIAVLSFSWVVYYFYSGIDAEHSEGRVDGAQDAALHRSYSDEKESFAALGVRVIGISSQSEAEQLETIRAHRLVHRMLIDPACQYARLLNLPVFEVDGRTYYQRLALLTCDRRVAHAFFPVEAASRNPSQVLTWMRVHGPGPSA